MKKPPPVPPLDDAVLQEQKRQNLEILKRVPRDSWLALMNDGLILPPDYSQGATDYIFFNGKKQLREIGARASAGDGTAAKYLLNMARKAVGDLTWVAMKHPQLLDTWAAMMNDWPVSWPRNKSRQREIEALWKRIGLGKNSTLKWKGKTFDAWGPSNKIALELQQKVQRHQSYLWNRMFQVSFKPDNAQTLKELKQNAEKIATINDPLERKILELPTFGQGTLDKWFPVAWEYLLRETGKHPEKVPELLKLGKHRISKARITRWKEKNPDKHFSPNSEVREGIRGELKKSFERMAG